LPANPVILFNKIDLLTSNQQFFNDLEAEYQSIGYPVIKTSNILDQGFEQLHTVLKSRTSIFVGLSGVGKSSLINHLLPEQDIRVGELSEATGEGKHTTTNSMLYHLDGGGELIDSPGVRDFGLWNTSADCILDGFVEIRPFSGQCRFSNCHHDNEPDCAIKQALQTHKISVRRFKSYKKMLKEYT
ncbi:MAG: ribosome small subunit-dependent GTPase A, partial [Gammaproteobacteria bacterium]|nr:ribosome small subunit-dependent GTPase A [Gammaproteobacteria bacterium]